MDRLAIASEMIRGTTRKRLRAPTAVMVAGCRAVTAIASTKSTMNEGIGSITHECLLVDSDGCRNPASDTVLHWTDQAEVGCEEYRADR